MSGARSLRGRVLARFVAAFGLAAAQPAAGMEYTRFELLPITPARATAQPAPALLNLPPTWQAGDAAVVMMVHPPGAHALQDTLLGALLAHGAAVLELRANASRGLASEGEAPGGAPAESSPPVTAGSLARDLLTALRDLRRDYAPGIVVAIGHGLGGEAVLLAAQPDVAAPLFGTATTAGFAAHAALGPGAAAFRAGATPHPDEAWPTRGRLLCEALAWAHAVGATPRPPEGEIRAAQAAAEQACRAALLPVAAGLVPVAAR